MSACDPALLRGDPAAPGAGLGCGVWRHPLPSMSRAASRWPGASRTASPGGCRPRSWWRRPMRRKRPRTGARSGTSACRSMPGVTTRSLPENGRSGWTVTAADGNGCAAGQGPVPPAAGAHLLDRAARRGLSPYLGVIGHLQKRWAIVLTYRSGRESSRITAGRLRREYWRNASIWKTCQRLARVYSGGRPTMAEAATVCLEERGHGREVALQVTGEFAATYLLQRPVVTEPMRASYDAEEATEFGAWEIAILVSATRQARRSSARSRVTVLTTGWEQWTRPGRSRHGEAGNLGNTTGDESRITTRLKEKRAQVRARDTLLPAYVAIVEFSRPETRVEKQ